MDNFSNQGAAQGHDAVCTFDVSDLLAYFPSNRAPTGIQRVQMEVITHFLQTDLGGQMRLCRFIKEMDRWVEVSIELFMRLCETSKAGGDVNAKDWLDAYNNIDNVSRSNQEINFPYGSILVNLGSSWWLPNYFMQIRYLKSTMGVKYIPLIYDMIPATTPHNCIPELVTEFIAWMVGVLEHADYFLAISNATKIDLIDLAAKVGCEISPDLVGVVPLDADYGTAVAQKSTLLSEFPPVSGKYVLFVSTLEPRKNQLVALDAWRSLISEYGLEKTPMLVLVGKQGYNGHLVLDRIAQDDVLKKRVTVLSGLDDRQLSSLYQNCLFTLYPSSYEGWGLPVTESLCHGKVPLISDSSSLPEAGGRFAVYFANGSGAELSAKIRKLIFDDSYRKNLERTIQADFRPRSWRDIASQIETLIGAWLRRIDRSKAWQPPIARPGYYYGFARANARTIWKGMGTAESFRQGVHWWELEGWGCWSKASGGGLQMQIAADGRPVRLALELNGLPNMDTDVEIRLSTGAVLAKGFLRRDGRKWLFVDIDRSDEPIDLRLIASEAGAAPGDTRGLGVGLKGFFILDRADPDAQTAFVEAAALGSLHDLSYYRRLIGN